MSTWEEELMGQLASEAETLAWRADKGILSEQERMVMHLIPTVKPFLSALIVIAQGLSWMASNTERR